MRSKERTNIVRVPTNNLFGKYLELVAEGIESISLGQGRACSLVVSYPIIIQHRRLGKSPFCVSGGRELLNHGRRRVGRNGQHNSIRLPSLVQTLHQQHPPGLAENSAEEIVA